MGYDVYELYQQCKDELLSIGCPIFNDGNASGEFKVVSNISSWGRCQGERHTSEKIFRHYKISIAEKCVKFGKAFVRNTIIHELIHTVPGGLGYNHRGEWKKWAERATEALNCTITQYYNVESAVEEAKEMGLQVSNLDYSKYVLKCPKCGGLIYKHRMCDMVRFPDKYWHTDCGENYRFERVK